MAALEIRPLVPADVEQLYAISLATGYRGGDAAPLYRDPRLIGHIYSAPYAKLCPSLCFVAEDDDGVAGFVCGATDTRAFEQRLERDWWPALRAIYAAPAGDPSDWTADERRCDMIHHPRPAPEAIVAAYPAHVHLNLLPRVQRRGVGSALLDRWTARACHDGARAVHAGVNAENDGAKRFWLARGFAPLPSPDPARRGTDWFGRAVKS